ncbi:OmpA family protein [Falsiroseomonas sp.]|uniref:OmpA family protein n=1 Tax=Falsiroseomonas sp. TaxID=2870721 RepID=UPI003562EFC1
MLRLLPLLAAGALAAACIVPGVASAQRTPTAEDMINQLYRGAAREDDAGRGIRRPRLTDPGTTAAPQPRAGTGAAAGTAAAGAQPPPGTAGAQSAERPMINLNVQFHTNSAELTPQAMRVLDELGRALNDPRLAPDRFRIAGHTDTVGPTEYNQRLSERRAAAVMDYLTTRYGVETSRIEAVGMGEEDLLVRTPDNTANARNRRVQVVNISG